MQGALAIPNKAYWRYIAVKEGSEQHSSRIFTEAINYRHSGLEPESSDIPGFPLSRE